MTTELIGYAAMALFGAGLLGTTLVLARLGAPGLPTLGARGQRRRRALSRGGSFRLVEPPMRVVSGWIGRLPIDGARREVQRELVRAGDWLGLSPDEYFALCVVSALGFGIFGAVLMALGAFGWTIVLVFVAVGGLFPRQSLRSAAKERIKRIERGLPDAIDVASLCMGAGLDFPASLDQIAGDPRSIDGYLLDEIRRMLDELRLGHTRKQALEGFARRAPGEAVRDFVSAVVQAEEKGTPLAEILAVQARMLRMRRSVRAEEAAAKAAAKMMMPLMLIFCSILLLLLGPFAVRLSQGGIL